MDEERSTRAIHGKTMINPNPADDADSSKRSTLRALTRRVLLMWKWLVAVACLLAGWMAIEYASESAYQASVEATEAYFRQDRMATLTVSALRKQLHGWYSVSDEPRGVQRFSWPSITSQHYLFVRTRTSGELLGYSSDGPFREPRLDAGPTSDIAAIPEGSFIVLADLRSQGALLRELPRQALYRVASQQFGLDTFDTLLGEKRPAAAATSRWPLDLLISSSVDDSDALEVSIVELVPGRLSFLATRKFRLPAGQTIAKYASEVNEWCDTEFAAVLERIGHQRRAVPSDTGKQEIDPDVVGWSLRLDLPSQFQAVRMLEQQVASEGAATPVLLRLAMCYVNLGCLTERHWSYSHKVWTARALLCCERAIKQSPEAADAYWTRAYVRAIVGLLSASTEDITTAKRLGGTEPDWAGVLNQFVNCKPAACTHRPTSKRPFESLLILRACESYAPGNQLLESVGEILQQFPSLHRCVESLVSTNQIGAYHEASWIGKKTIGRSISGSLTQIPELTKELDFLKAMSRDDIVRPRVRQLLGGEMEGDELESFVEPELFRKTINVLRKVDSPAFGLSWPVLGAIMEDCLFAQVQSELVLQRSKLAVDTSETISWAQRAIPDHPLHHVFAACSFPDVSKGLAAFGDVFTAVRKLPVGNGAQSLYFLQVVDASINFALDAVNQQYDETLSDLITEFRRAAWRTGQVSSRRMEAFMKVAPVHPRAIANQASFDWKTVSKVAKEWEETYAQQPIVLQALAEQYRARHAWEDEQRCLKLSLASEPDANTLLMLADVCYRREDWDEYLSALNQCESIETSGLHNAMAGNRLAYFYMAKGDWKKAKPHADLAAQSYSGWGLVAAQDCYEALKRYREAEQFARACTERYDSSRWNWYLWCARTGRGDIKQASQFAMQEHPVFGKWQQSREAMCRAIYFEMEGDLVAAQAEILKNNAEYPSLHSYHRFLLARLAHKRGELNERDKWLKELASDDELQIYPALAQSLLSAMANKTILLTDETLEFLVALHLPKEGYAENLFVIATTLMMNGEEQRSRSWLERAAAVYSTEREFATLAAMELRKMGLSAPPPDHEVHSKALAFLSKAANESEFENERGNLARAVALRSEAVSKYPDLMLARYYRARLLWFAGRFREALADYDVLIERIPGLAELHRQRAYILASLGRNREAQAGYRQALEINSGHRPSHVGLGWSLLLSSKLRDRDSNEALQHAETALGLPGHDGWGTSFLKAVCLADLGDHDRALATAEAAWPTLAAETKEAYKPFYASIQRRQPVSRTVRPMQLLATVPEEGRYGIYRVVVKSGEAATEMVATLKCLAGNSAGQTWRRNIEVELAGGPFSSKVVDRVSFPMRDKTFGQIDVDVEPVVWVKTGDADASKLARPYEPFVLSVLIDGVFNNQDRDDQLAMINIGESTVSCDVYTATGWKEEGARNTNGVLNNAVKWKLFRATEAPCELVRAEIEVPAELSGGITQIEIELQSQGTDATESLPSLRHEVDE
jgi:tetratricopeptide (TPR) repeat protein